MNRALCVYVAILFMLAALFGGCSAERGTADRDVDRIADPGTSDAAMSGLVQHVRLGPPTQEELRVWRNIANSGEFSPFRRRLAVFQLFDRFISPNMTLGEVAEVLDHPTWLEQDQVIEVRYSGGYIPMVMFSGEAVFLVVPRLPADDTSAGVAHEWRARAEET